METGSCKWNCAGDKHRLLAGRRRSPSTTRTFKALMSKGCVVWPPAHTHATECPCLIMKSAARGFFPGSWQPRNTGWKLYSEVRNNKLIRAEPLSKISRRPSLEANQSSPGGNFAAADWRRHTPADPTDLLLPMAPA